MLFGWGSIDHYNISRFASSEFFINFSNCKSRREKSFVSNECIKKIKCMFNNKQNFLHCRDRMVSFFKLWKIKFLKIGFSSSRKSGSGLHWRRPPSEVPGFNRRSQLAKRPGQHWWGTPAETSGQHWRWKLTPICGSCPQIPQKRIRSFKVLYQPQFVVSLFMRTAAVVSLIFFFFV